MAWHSDAPWGDAPDITASNDWGDQQTAAAGTASTSGGVYSQWSGPGAIWSNTLQDWEWRNIGNMIGTVRGLASANATELKSMAHVDLWYDVQTDVNNVTTFPQFWAVSMASLKEDLVPLSPDAAYIDFDFRLDGTVDQYYDFGPDRPVPAELINASELVGAPVLSTTDPRRYDAFGFQPPYNVIRSSQTLRVPVVAGVVRLDLSLQTSVMSPNLPGRGVSQITVDFSNTMQLLSATVLDSSGNPTLDQSIYSADPGGLPNLIAVQAAPEPGTWSAGLLAVLALGLRKLRR